jgi:enoyl-CoA hydratase/carnithine racemase
VTRLDRDEGLAVLTIDEPPLNLYTTSLQFSLLSILDELEADPARALLIRADGRVVGGGVDVALFDAQGSAAEARGFLDALMAVSDRFAALPFPTVFAAHGLCLTWAFEVALACDLLWAASSAKFGLVEKTVGLTPAMGGTARLAARAGVARAKELVYTGETFAASALQQWNVVNRVLPDDGFDAAVRAFAAELAAGPTRAHAATKRVLAHFEHGGVPEANAHVTAIAAELFDTEDTRGAVKSFLNDGPGKARFTGR